MDDFCLNSSSIISNHVISYGILLATYFSRTRVTRAASLLSSYSLAGNYVKKKKKEKKKEEGPIRRRKEGGRGGGGGGSGIAAAFPTTIAHVGLAGLIFLRVSLTRRISSRQRVASLCMADLSPSSSLGETALPWLSPPHPPSPPPPSHFDLVSSGRKIY